MARSAAAAADRPTPVFPLVSLGDYNAYQFNDGYTDPIAVLKGQPTPDEQVVVDGSPDLVDPNYLNLTDSLPASERYSFILRERRRRWTTCWSTPWPQF